MMVVAGHHRHGRPAPDRLRRAPHATIDQIGHDLTELRFSTAIAHLTRLNNELAAVVRERGTYPRGIAEPLVVMLAPFAPHITEELWYRLGHHLGIADVEFPTADLGLVQDDDIELPVQADGKPRGSVSVPADADEHEAIRAIRNDLRISGCLDVATVQRVIYVRGRIINFRHELHVASPATTYRPMGSIAPGRT